jgi:predicted phage-related endonuclease
VIPQELLDSPMFTVHVMGSREEWKASRFLGIGASEWAAVLGMDPRRSQLEVYADKRRVLEDVAAGRPPHVDPEDEDEAEEWLVWGQELQPAVARVTGRRFSYEVTDLGQWTILRSTLWPWMYATLDYAVRDTQRSIATPGPWGVLECKNAAGWLEDEWLPGTGGPRPYQIQVQAQLATTGWTWGALSGLLGGNRLRHHRHARHDAFIDRAVGELADFWDRVMSGRAPKPDYTESSARGLAKLYNTDVGDVQELPPIANVWLAQWEESHRLAKRAEELEAEAKQEVQAMMGRATYATIPGEPDRVFKWKTQTGKPVACQGCGAEVRKGYTTRVFDVVKAKGRTK